MNPSPSPIFGVPVTFNGEALRQAIDDLWLEPPRFVPALTVSPRAKRRLRAAFAVVVVDDALGGRRRGGFVGRRDRPPRRNRVPFRRRRAVARAAVLDLWRTEASRWP